MFRCRHCTSELTQINVKWIGWETRTVCNWWKHELTEYGGEVELGGAEEWLDEGDDNRAGDTIESDEREEVRMYECPECSAEETELYDLVTVVSEDEEESSEETLDGVLDIEVEYHVRDAFNRLVYSEGHTLEEAVAEVNTLLNSDAFYYVADAATGLIAYVPQSVLDFVEKWEQESGTAASTTVRGVGFIVNPDGYSVIGNSGRKYYNEVQLSQAIRRIHEYGRCKNFAVFNTVGGGLVYHPEWYTPTGAKRAATVAPEPSEAEDLDALVASLE